jgi:hypothetical protein
LEFGEGLAGEDEQGFVFRRHGVRERASGGVVVRVALRAGNGEQNLKWRGESEVGLGVGTGGGDVGADDAAVEVSASLDVGVGPEEAIVQGGTGFDDGMGADDVVADEGGGGVDLGERMDGGLAEGGASLGEVGV